MNIEITGFREYKKNTLQGFLTLLITDIGIEIKDCTLHQQGDKQWVGLPAKPYTDKEGALKYVSILNFEGNHYWDFQNAVLDALKNEKARCGGGQKQKNSRVNQ